MAVLQLVRRVQWYRWYVVAALAVVYCLSIVDRSLLSILQEPIKAELHLSDSQLGSLTGLAFAAFYATLAVPIARIADRSNRVAVMCAALLLWSATTAFCGLAVGFLTLLAARMGVGVGEAGGYPSAVSVLTDYFEKQWRATALAVFGLAAPLGQSIGLFSAGALEATVGWRNTFLLMGGFGLLVAPLVYFTVREPKRGGSDEESDSRASAQGMSLWAVTRVLWRLKSIRYLYSANMAQGFVLYAYMAWQPPFYARTFHMSVSAVAHWLGLLSLLGVLGCLVAGVLSDRLGRRDPRWYVWVLAVSSAIFAPAALAQFLARDAGSSLLWATAPQFLLLFFVAPTIAAGQTLVLAHMRATTAAVMLMVYNIVGLGLGPLFVGVVSDLLKDRFGLGVDSLRYAIILALSAQFIAVAFYIKSGQAMPRDAARDKSLDFADPSAKAV